MPKRELADVEVTLVHETVKAYRVTSHLTGITEWVPKSVGELDDGVLTLPVAWAEDKGLV